MVIRGPAFSIKRGSSLITALGRTAPGFSPSSKTASMASAKRLASAFGLSPSSVLITRVALLICSSQKNSSRTGRMSGVFVSAIKVLLKDCRDVALHSKKGALSSVCFEAKGLLNKLQKLGKSCDLSVFEVDAIGSGVPWESWHPKDRSCGSHNKARTRV